MVEFYESTPAQPCATPADRRRARELYRYFRPDRWDDSRVGDPTSLPSSPNIALTAYAQLVAVRFNVQRAIISLIDKDTMFFVAEATKSTHLHHSETADEDGVSLWAGCAASPKSGRLCDWTIALEPLAKGFATFVVGDMSQDERFKDLDFVTGPPCFRLYVGTPLTTKHGINIGSLYVLDDKPREVITDDQVTLLGTMASTIMAHLEIQRDAAIGRRMGRFNQGLNSFIDGDSTLDPPPAKPFETTVASALGHEVGETLTPNSKIMTELRLAASNGASSQESTDTPSILPVHDPVDALTAGYPSTFARAANLLRESLELDEEGGVVFFDASNGVFQGQNFNRRGSVYSHETGSDNQTRESIPSSSGQPLLNRSVNAYISLTTTPNLPRNLAKISAMSTAKHPLLMDITGKHPVRRIDETLLQDLSNRYPKGKLWVFDEDGSLSSSEDDLLFERFPTKGTRQSKKSRRKQTEAYMLQQQSSTLLQHFPGVRQLLFIPLWDAASSRWSSGCFCWSTAETQVFTSDVELTYLSNFGKTIMAECSRVDTILADQQKSDFIGSVSHELRSPLHGILASSEFLSETTIDTYQRSLADTIDACGRTLLDTINHVLDFSKINSFERTWKKDKNVKSRSRGSSDGVYANSIPKDAPPLLNIYAVVDVAAVTEEVVEGVSVGHIYDNISSQDITDISAESSGRTANKGLRLERVLSDGPGTLADEARSRRHLEVFLDIENTNWTFVTQPGALRRVIMNVFGNALKYTSFGMIRVALKTESLPNPDPSGQEIGKMVTITISDTGKGISPEFLRSKLYTPFAQENSLAPGTGLGLSIVRGIVTMLGGTINFQSEVGKGSIVTVSMPLLRPSTTETSSSASTPMSVNTASQDDSIDLLLKEVDGRTVAIHGVEDSKNPTPYLHEAQKCLVQYLTVWYGLPVVKWSPSVEAEVIFVDEFDLPMILKTQRSRTISLPGILVLCNNAAHSRRQAKCDGLDDDWIIEYVAKPYGPYKLAKALRACLAKVDLLRSGEVPISETVTSPAIDGDARVKLDDLALGSPDGVPLNGGVTVEAASNQIRRAFSTPMDIEPTVEFPFPEILTSSQERMITPRPNGNVSSTPEKDKYASNKRSQESVVVPDHHNEEFLTPLVPAKPILPKRIPSVLLVDDNKINLRLLQTFMKKRKYELVDSADDGRMAVDAFANFPCGYDIVFMDISMPIMNGFEATQAIRELEKQRSEQGLKTRPPAMIIALTGLASGKDQAQAFSSGIDLYVTKPASFKEVSKLLDNWESNTSPDNV